MYSQSTARRDREVRSAGTRGHLEAIIRIQRQLLTKQMCSAQHLSSVGCAQGIVLGIGRVLCTIEATVLGPSCLPEIPGVTA